MSNKRKLLIIAKKNMIDKDRNILKSYDYIADNDKEYSAIAEVMVGKKENGSIDYTVVKDTFMNDEGIVKDTLNEWTYKDIMFTFFS